MIQTLLSFGQSISTLVQFGGRIGRRGLEGVSNSQYNAFPTRDVLSIFRLKVHI